MECSNLASCAFVEAYENDSKISMAVRGFLSSHCHGDKENICVRKIIKQNLGPDKLPLNMMPSGHPVPGTTMSDWADEIPPILKKSGL
jgi:hypothetical protein